MFFLLGKDCTEEDRSDRPAMDKICDVLERWIKNPSLPLPSDSEPVEPQFPTVLNNLIDTNNESCLQIFDDDDDEDEEEDSDDEDESYINSTQN